MKTGRVDSFTHVLPREYLRALGEHELSSVWAGSPALTDIPLRLRIMDEFGVAMQVLTLMAPPIEYLPDSIDGVGLAALANDGIAQIVSDHPDRFIGVASVSLVDPDAAIDELNRAVNDLGLSGAMIYSNAAGAPLDEGRFETFFAAAARLRTPLWLHPYRSSTPGDYASEQVSKYRLWLSFGWPMETTMTMARLVFSGVLLRHPELRIIVHHAGSLIPSLANRISTIYRGEDIKRFGLDPGLEEPLLDQFRQFYVDTAVTSGGSPALTRAVEFFGAHRVLFGTDFPLGLDEGREFVRYGIDAVEGLDLPSGIADGIWSGNLGRLIGRYPNGPSQ